ncbi:MAG TPA: hypothetical protein VFY93_17640 [Planctomycetota bacterium]|nr:hypothetical protein [Planctomycetota bacterium]
MLLALLLCMASGPETVETEHYRLVSEGPRAEAEEFGRVLEAAHARFASYFKAAPKLGKGERLQVRFFETREAWAAALREAKATPPDGAGGYYWTEDRTAYLYRQPTRLFTRALLLHETTHQFHFLSRTRNREPQAYWYKEGVAECLGWSHWDGTELLIGALPLVSLEDYPAKALEDLRGSVDLEAVVEGRAEPSRPLAWAIYRHLSTGNAGKPLRGFERIADKLDNGAKPSSIFWKSFGQPAAYRKALIAWLEKEQQPFVPLFVEWDSLGADRVRGFSGGMATCRLRAKATTLAVTIQLPERGWGGGLIHATGPEDYTVFLVDRAGHGRVSRRRAGAWENIEQGTVPVAGEDGSVRLEMTLKDGSVRVGLDGGVTFGPWELPDPALGLAVDGADVVFRDLAWR